MVSWLNGHDGSALAGNAGTTRRARHAASHSLAVRRNSAVWLCAISCFALVIAHASFKGAFRIHVPRVDVQPRAIGGALGSWESFAQRGRRVVVELDLLLVGVKGCIDDKRRGLRHGGLVLPSVHRLRKATAQLKADVPQHRGRARDRQRRHQGRNRQIGPRRPGAEHAQRGQADRNVADGVVARADPQRAQLASPLRWRYSSRATPRLAASAAVATTPMGQAYREGSS